MKFIWKVKGEMKMESDTMIKIAMVSIVTAIIGSVIMLGFSFVDLIYSEDSFGDSFCEMQVDDRVSLAKTYSQYYGKIGCQSSFDGETIEKTFDVERKFGRFRIK